MSKYQKYFEAVRFLEGLNNLPIEKIYVDDPKYPKIYLRRMQYFLNLVGNPEKGFRYMHITGTAGKGSVANMLHSLLVASGKKAGLFTSPYVTTSIEKIKVGRHYIDPNVFAAILGSIKPAIDEAYAHSPYGGPAYFEIYFAMALLYFKKMNCEWVVLEVAAGGRYDATNVIAYPVYAVITNIGLDHSEFLGKTLKNIAWQKAGIIKKGCRFFTSECRRDLKVMFKDICEQLKVPARFLGQSSLSYRQNNERLVRAIGRDLGIKSGIISQATAVSHLPARFETMQLRPRVILDGAHNPLKVQSLVENLSKLSYYRLILIIGLAQDKNINGILKKIVPLADQVYLTRFQTPKRKCVYPPDLLKSSKRFKNKKTTLELFMDPGRALKQAIQKAQKRDLILVTGSFFLTGELRQYWYPEELILNKRQFDVKSNFHYTKEAKWRFS